ncbi:helix-turn-helix transcriptional regulator [Amycolatopsis sp. PS_44_ISF1]|uniref:helix-turn-helix transcriptional regulator n=1 Tax=Amycolatopsis sp. PS_44_ISF1 TaxID=2974917 RepID=UPI0028DE73B7|nr:helix-turn-helix transcriptional regulator [Amycolatopsis sp. PS_44_ISF1]MDT8914702.1 helix-turn-helix transcriptional regulator [Amycolatopsis sp. PS_44_ISF1]
MQEFAEALRAWRDRLSPQAVGLPPGPRRRAAGLRREELAGLAGVSVEYLVRLEQGRARNPSPPLLGALARALRLTDEERDHLFRVAGAAPPSPEVVPQHIGPGVQRMLDRLGDVPMGVFSAAWDLLWWNPLWAALTGDPSPDRGLDRNIAWRHFMNAPSAMDFDHAHAQEFSDDLAADLREALGRYPADTALEDLVARLRAGSPDFERRWRRAHVARHRSSTKTATTTPAGPITIDCDVLTAPGTDLRIVMYTVEPDSEDASKLDLLRVSGTQALTSPSTS